MILDKILKNRKYIPYIFHIIYFNFKYLPIKQAKKLPIFLYKPKFINFGGKITIDSNNVSFGMIRLGGYSVSIYHDRYGFIWENKGHCIFKGKCSIGNGSSLSTGEFGNVIFGNNFTATAKFKIVSYKSITFGKNVLVGWECLFLDTDFHALTTIKTNKLKSAVAEIIIGDNNWFGLKCTILKGTSTPDFCTIGANSVLNKKYSFPSYCLITGNPGSLKMENVYRNPEKDKIDYSLY